ncbi:RNA polymerase sigma factor SigJ [Nocardia sp. NBC_00508]|uniref:RNA polymerase sigma factor SigJ n=1 Tax=Nocardia sp. NBC_00508 TaxID=2975992 RepID=UPI002E81814E|nr:RNA polymerase sigma factor SigJ [Nocardia sp. NBC_00508]WUD64920.1 RNA polymerase sigma factor SigJ [Nocardia sp. NBC_00508]
MAETADEAATRVFADHRELLFSVVYTMLASVADTEDVLQETWLSWAARVGEGSDEIRHPRAYLVRIAVNQALARRAAISRRRETYVGPWLPEPLVTDTPQLTEDAAQGALRAESVSMAVLVVLETLTPLERAVFVLHEVFGYPHTDIAEILGRSPASIRQLAHRARGHVHARRPRYRADPRTQRRVTEKLVAAQRDGDLAGLLELLAPDVAFWSDGGGKRRAALRPIHGREKVARLLTGRNLLNDVPDFGVGYRFVNGDPAALIFSAGAPFAVLVLDIDPATDRIRGIYAVSNPDKLTRIEAGQRPRRG